MRSFHKEDSPRKRSSLDAIGVERGSRHIGTPRRRWTHCSWKHRNFRGSSQSAPAIELANVH
jgi:hypothetical protein